MGQTSASSTDWTGWCVLVTGSSGLLTDRQLYRPADVELLQGDYTKAATRLKWKPTVSFQALVQEMVDANLQCFKGGELVLSLSGTDPGLPN